MIVLWISTWKENMAGEWGANKKIILFTTEVNKKVVS
jgi:hypothetical protein